MALQLREFAEDWNLVLSTYIRQPTTITPSPEDPILSFDHHKKPHICAPIDTYIHTKRCVHIHIYT